MQSIQAGLWKTVEHTVVTGLSFVFVATVAWLLESLVAKIRASGGSEALCSVLHFTSNLLLLVDCLGVLFLAFVGAASYLA